MTEERKQLIERFQKWLDTNPAPCLIASQCANIAEEYAKGKAMRYKAGLLGKTYLMTELAEKMFTEEHYKTTKMNFDNFKVHIKELYKKHFNELD